MVPNPGVALAREMQTQMETRITPSDCVFVDDKSTDEDVAFCSEVNANAVETDEEDSQSTEASRASEHRPWKTTLIRLGRLSGICSVILAVSSLVAALGVLVGSRGAAKASWSVPP